MTARRKPGDPVYDALAVQREVDAAWKLHKQHCARCGSQSRIAQAACDDGIALRADVEDAARVVALRREQEQLAAWGQGALFDLAELDGQP